MIRLIYHHIGGLEIPISCLRKLLGIYHHIGGLENIEAKWGRGKGQMFTFK
jgi:hypothetical protein